MHIQSAGLTDVGLRREHNEDAFIIDDTLGLFVVADGMGGHAAGEMASALCVKGVHTYLSLLFDGQDLQHSSSTSIQDSRLQTPAVLLAQSIQVTSREIFEIAQSNHELAGMGTTVVACLYKHGCLAVAHVGDSRVYLCRGDEIVQLTDDHSLMNEQIKLGFSLEDQQRFLQYKNVITRSVGYDPMVVVDCHTVIPEPGDLFILCSDGISNLIKAEEMVYACTQVPLQEVPQTLINLGNFRGGDDNMTVVAFKFMES